MSESTEFSFLLTCIVLVTYAHSTFYFHWKEILFFLSSKDSLILFQPQQYRRFHDTTDCFQHIPTNKTNHSSSFLLWYMTCSNILGNMWKQPYYLSSLYIWIPQFIWRFFLIIFFAVTQSFTSWIIQFWRKK